ncbi:MAG: M23 family metallopeptidase [Acidobacteriota bacterium]|nr:M23 family metallopeptidase [Acidobacteriota bacterium]
MRIPNNVLKTDVLATVLAILFANVWMFACSARGAEVPQCSGGLQMRLSAPLASQGSVLVVEVRSAKSVGEITGTWMERSVYFWKSDLLTLQRRGAVVERALVGVDLEKAPGTYKLTTAATLENGEHAVCSTSLTIRAGKFATERLTVEKQFVEPNEQQAARAVAEQQKLRLLFDHVSPQKLWKGDFQFPLKGVTKGTNFGKRRILNGQPRSPHTGADFPVLTGTPVYATQSGHVALAEELYFSGNTVIIDHGLGVYSLYGHLSAFEVAVGDDVKAGAVIGKVGSTGRATGPHLHWGVTVNKARINPVQLVGVLRIRRKQ